MNIGVGFLILAMLLTPAVDGVAKILSADHSAMTIAFIRYLSAGLIALALAGLTGRRIHIPAGDRIGQIWRTCLIMGAMTSLIAALGMTSMARVAGGFLIAPIVSGLLGIIVWRERPTAARLIGSAVAIFGAVILMRPEAAVEAGSLFALLGGALLGTYLAATRGAAARTDPLSTLAVQCLLGAAMLAPFALWAGSLRVTLELLWSALALGGISATCHLLTVAAYQRVEAIVLAPFLYFNMITAIAVGYFWFGETLSIAGVLGLAGIASGGLITLFRFDAIRLGGLKPGGRRFT